MLILSCSQLTDKEECCDRRAAVVPAQVTGALAGVQQPYVVRHLGQRAQMGNCCCRRNCLREEAIGEEELVGPNPAAPHYDADGYVLSALTRRRTARTYSQEFTPLDPQ